MKGELAARAVAFAELARSGEPPPGDVVLVAESDEERNTADVGMSWLVRERPDLRCDYALNEGGGVLLELADGRRVVTVSVGEKQVASLRLRIFGTAGHASVPGAPTTRSATPRARSSACSPTSPAAALGELAAGARGARRRRREASAIAGPGAAPGARATTLPAMARMTVTPDRACRAIEPRERDPAVRRRDLRLPRAARPGRGRHPRPRRGGARRRLRLRARAARAARGRHRVADRHAALPASARSYVAERLAGAALLPLVSAGLHRLALGARPRSARSPTASPRSSTPTRRPTTTACTAPTSRSRRRPRRDGRVQPARHRRGQVGALAPLDSLAAFYLVALVRRGGVSPGAAVDPLRRPRSRRGCGPCASPPA